MALKAGQASPEETRRICSLLDNPGADKPERLLKTKDVARAWECHPKSVLRYAERGLIKPVRRSKRCLRWRSSDVERIALQGI